MGFIRSYLDFMFREPPATKSFIVESIPNYVMYYIFSSLFFSSVFVFTPWIMKTFFKKFYKSLSDQKKKDFPSYIASYCHHLILGPLGFYLMYKDFMLPPSEYATFDHAAQNCYFIPISFGYMVADTIFFTFGEVMQGKYEYLIHHTMSLILVSSIMQCPSPLARYITHVGICESSQIVFNTVWMLKLGKEPSPLVPYFEILFAVVYFFVRVVNLPLMTLAVTYQRSEFYSNVVTFILWPIVLMQFYWFYKIIKSVLRRMKKPKKN